MLEERERERGKTTSSLSLVSDGHLRTASPRKSVQKRAPVPTHSQHALQAWGVERGLLSPWEQEMDPSVEAV